MTTQTTIDPSTMLNLSTYHREHEKFYAYAPLERALELQRDPANLGDQVQGDIHDAVPVPMPPDSVRTGGAERPGGCHREYGVLSQFSYTFG